MPAAAPTPTPTPPTGGSKTLTLKNTIVSGNTVTGAPLDVTGTLDPTSSFNLIGTGGGLVNGTGKPAKYRLRTDAFPKKTCDQ